MSTLRLGKYRIDPVLFKKGFAQGCGPFHCESKCCSAGVYVDLKEKEKILSYKEMIKKYMDETQITDDSRWFDSEIEDDQDYPSGKAVGTEIVNGKCVFLNKKGKCSLQVMGNEEGLGGWAIKPYFCIAFPISVEDGVLTFDDFLQGDTQCCSTVRNFETTLVDSCKTELEFVLGKEGYQQLQNLKPKN